MAPMAMLQDKNKPHKKLVSDTDLLVTLNLGGRPKPLLWPLRDDLSEDSEP
jgi:hypothetical protein